MEFLTNETFDGAIKSGIVLIDFYADWCGPCKMMEPVIDELASEMEGKAVIAKVNVDEYSDIASRYQIFSIPTFIIFKDGKEIERMIGAVGKSGILDKLQGYITK